MLHKYDVTLQASVTVRFNRTVDAIDEESARNHMKTMMRAIDSGLAIQQGEFFGTFQDASFEVTEAPKLEHDFTDRDIEVSVHD